MSALDQDPNPFQPPPVQAGSLPPGTSPATQGSPSANTPPASGSTSTLTPDQESAYDLINATLASWGLSTLAQTAIGFIQQGLTSDEITLKLQQTDQYKERFAGNAERAAAGLSTLSPAEYISLEDQYTQTLRAYGIPAGFYDDKNATDAWIGGDVSASEVADRAKAASDLVYNSPPEAMQAWSQFYGGGTGGAIAAILDPSKAEPIVLQQVQAAQVGGAALAQGLTTSATRAAQLVQGGVTLQGAQQAYSNIAQRLSTDLSVSGRFQNQATGTLDQTAEENATLLGNADALKKQQTLYTEENAQFGNHGGANDTSGNPGANY